jgi:hypothetical protein
MSADTHKMTVDEALAVADELDTETGWTGRLSELTGALAALAEVVRTPVVRAALELRGACAYEDDAVPYLVPVYAVVGEVERVVVVDEAAVLVPPTTDAEREMAELAEDGGSGGWPGWEFGW